MGLSRTVATGSTPSTSSGLNNEAFHPLYQFEDYLRGGNKGQTTQHESVEKRQDEVLRVAEFLFGTTQLTAALALLDNHERHFTKVSSTHRSLWLVKGSSGEFSYMCFACDETPDLYYCNCRSFLEKTTKIAQANRNQAEICKHLLALKLIPELGLSCPHLQVSEIEFARLVLDRTMGRAGK